MRKHVHKKNYIPIILNIFALAITIFLILYGMSHDWFSNGRTLAIRVHNMGPMAPIIFIFIQIVQVVLPIIPGGASSLAGVFGFGPFYGFIYNYIGLCLGSMIAFYLSRKYGPKVVSMFLSDRSSEKYMDKKNSKMFTLLFFLAIVLPGFPDDIFCYVAGLSKMSTKTFLLCIFIGKFISLLIYSTGYAFFPYLFLKS